MHIRERTRPSESATFNTPASVCVALGKLDPSDRKYRELLCGLFSHRDLKPYIQGLHGTGLEGLVELLDKALDHIPVTDELSPKILRRLQSICGNRGVLPRSHTIPNESLLNTGRAIASGGFADAHEAILDGRKVCVKALRLFLQGTSEGITKEAFYREVVVWKRLRHPNIVPFLGVPTKIPPFEIVCEWMDNDRITEYVKKNPEVDRVGLLWDVADGLRYLHSCNIIHGDLKGANVLIDGKGCARLTGFGLTSVIRAENSLDSPQDPNATNATKWAAPEILTGGAVSKEGDVFTFAMVAIETFTGNPPFPTNIHTVALDIIRGKRPGRPAALDHEELWDTVKRCWGKQPRERPTASQLLEFFQTSFPRIRDTSKGQPLHSKPSAWTLGGIGNIGGNPERHQDPPGQDIPDVGEPGLRELPTGAKPSRFNRGMRKLKKFMEKLFGRKTRK